MTKLNGSDEILLVANKPGITESGGGHGTKGVDFQRWWSVLRMLELEQAGAHDFLILFESVQDVTELDSASQPTFARVYQVKKKDRGEWSWNALTGTSNPSVKTKAKKLPILSRDEVEASPLGKLHLSLDAFTTMPVEGHFISNAGCDIPLAAGGNAATSMPCSLSELAPNNVALLSSALHLLCEPSTSAPNLERLKLRKVAIHPDAPDSRVVHVALDFLTIRSPRHAAQAASFVESLVIRVSPLGRKTDSCASYEQLVKERGFSRDDFVAALDALEETPDYLAYLEDWLRQLQNEGMNFMVITRIKVQAARVFRENLQGIVQPLTQSINEYCDAWIGLNSPPSQLMPYFSAGLAELKTKFSGFRDEELLARFALRAIKSCVDPT